MPILVFSSSRFCLELAGLGQVHTLLSLLQVALAQGAEDEHQQVLWVNPSELLLRHESIIVRESR